MYAAIRAVSIAVAAYRVSLGKVAHWHFSLPQLLGSWDAKYYRMIAAHGYGPFGAVHSTGAALAAAFGVAAAAAVARGVRDRAPLRSLARPLAAAAIAPLGMLGY